MNDFSFISSKNRMILIFFMVFWSSYGQNFTLENDCTENEQFSTYKDDLFCCDIEKEGDTMIPKTPPKIVRTIAPYVCMMVPTKQALNYSIVHEIVH